QSGMQQRTRKIYEAALALPDDERAQLVDELLSTLTWDEAAEAAWSAEIERRVSGIESGSREGVPWQEVRARARLIASGGAPNPVPKPAPPAATTCSPL